MTGRRRQRAACGSAFEEQGMEVGGGGAKGGVTAVWMRELPVGGGGGG